jgi:hypothetical protein
MVKVQTCNYPQTGKAFRLGPTVKRNVAATGIFCLLADHPLFSNGPAV